jgi:hypothetical protein
MISLFADQTPSTQTSYSFYLSAVFHCIIVLIVSTAVTYTPPVIVATIQRPLIRDLYIDAQLAFHRPPEQSPANHSDDPQPSQQHISQLKDTASNSPAQEPSDAPRVQVQPARVPRLEVNQDIPLISLMIWSAPDSANSIVHAPPPQPPVDADVAPLILETPIEKAPLAQIALVARDTDTAVPSIQPSATSPLTARDATNNRGVPEMASISKENASSARVLSLSNALATSGKVPLLQANIDTGPAGSARTLATSGSLDGHSPAGSGSGDAQSMRKVAFPKDGKFGMVVVGASLEELYPTVAAVWKGKIVYTVYLSVGTGSKWILQYARVADAPMQLKQTHLEAPWPTDIVVPNLQSGSFAGPLIVHGELEKDGTLARLSVVAPRDFDLSEFVLNALQQWHFRPAKEGGQPTPLEILLIIS